MQIQIISIGQKMPQWVEAGCADYVKRLPRELSLKWSTLPLAQRRNNASTDQLKQQEAEQIRQKLQPGSFNLALDEHGKHWSSRDWSKQLTRWMQEFPRVNVIIGGPDGLSPELLQSCDQNVSFGAMTMPHALVRIVLVEQIYRAWSLYQNHPYHRD